MFEMINLHLVDRPSFRAAMRQRMALSEHKGGLYTLSLQDAPGSSRLDKGVPRLGGVDTQGRLYIGHSRDLEARTSALFGSLTEPQLRAHEVGILWYRHPALPELLPLERLRIRVTPCADPRAAEAVALADYAREFAEAPPWNTRCR